MSARDDLRAAVERLAAEWPSPLPENPPESEYGPVQYVAVGAVMVADDLRAILAEHPAPAPSSDVTREELADWMRGEFPHYGLTKERIFDKVDQAEVIDALLARYDVRRRP